jgi:hypothetical protein
MYELFISCGGLWFCLSEVTPLFLGTTELELEIGAERSSSADIHISFPSSHCRRKFGTSKYHASYVKVKMLQFVLLNV